MLQAHEAVVSALMEEDKKIDVVKPNYLVQRVAPNKLCRDGGLVVHAQFRFLLDQTWRDRGAWVAWCRKVVCAPDGQSHGGTRKVFFTLQQDDDNESQDSVSAGGSDDYKSRSGPDDYADGSPGGGEDYDWPVGSLPVLHGEASVGGNGERRRLVAGGGSAAGTLTGGGDLAGGPSARRGNAAGEGSAGGLAAAGDSSACVSAAKEGRRGRRSSRGPMLTDEVSPCVSIIPVGTAEGPGGNSAAGTDGSSGRSSPSGSVAGGSGAVRGAIGRPAVTGDGCGSSAAAGDGSDGPVAVGVGIGSLGAGGDGPGAAAGGSTSSGATGGGGGRSESRTTSVIGSGAGAPAGGSTAAPAAPTSAGLHILFIQALRCSNEALGLAPGERQSVTSLVRSKPSWFSMNCSFFTDMDLDTTDPDQLSCQTDSYITAAYRARPHAVPSVRRVQE